MAVNYRLSDLPDDLLRCILRFLPSKQGASTAVLSRRWRSLWHTSGTVNLNTCSCDDYDDSKREAFIRGAVAALAAATEHGGPVTRLSFYMEADEWYSIDSFVSQRREGLEQNTIHDVISYPATRHVKELRVTGVSRNNTYHHNRGYYNLRIDVLPCQDLRVLHIVNAELDMGNKSDATISFPRLNMVQLHGCQVSLKSFRAMIHGAPQLTTLRLESIYMDSGRSGDDDSFSTNDCQFRGQEVTTLVLTDWSTCVCLRTKIGSVQLDMPKLRYFKFDGVLSDQQVSLKSWPDSLTRVDFHFKDTIHEAGKVLVPFWHMLRNFTSTKVLKVKLDCPIDHVAVVDMKTLDHSLDNKLLYNLVSLEVEGCYNPAYNVAGHAIGNLLHCCPMLRYLRLKINKATSPRYMSYDLARQVQFIDFDRSVKHFRRYRESSKKTELAIS
ncbi:hypothetical protein QOZ80_9BG0717190 [Eleusine coracana subsp. coracana]|nr:hypothetical protein QOZ80_9BG0717190 [Eleusine coracana subsp. coracana]